MTARHEWARLVSVSSADYQRRWRASKGARTGQPGRPITQPCGTVAAYKRHQRHGESPCEPCRAAWAERQRVYYQRRKGYSAGPT